MTLAEWAQYAPIVSATAIVISASVALGVFIYTRRTNRRRATLDMVMKTFIDDDSRKRYDSFKELVRKDKDSSDPFKLTSLSKLTSTNGVDRSIVVSQMNTYELVALGIRRGIFDEKFYKLWFHRQFTKDYESSMSLLQAVWEESPSIFCECKILYARWIKSRHPVSSPSRYKMGFWAITGNYKKLDAARKSMDS
ncbi:DUF4760 domain-containing protein [Sphingomonas sp. Leaf4]|uniref:DUF4760 domain-containing protein n=1 Tax=Sphingomonas sp. Leaf4 TaxID=2876553 RepID=UPI001E5A2760|nr:DUF4760 domain-containing protein [Sphingomonas sp. Leaf4]